MNEFNLRETHSSYGSSTQIVQEPPYMATMNETSDVATVICEWLELLRNLKLGKLVH